jgi:hypothetical protein
MYKSINWLIACFLVNLTDSFQSLYYVAPNGEIICEDKLEIIWTETVVAHSKIPSNNILRGMSKIGGRLGSLQVNILKIVWPGHDVRGLTACVLLPAVLNLNFISHKPFLHSSSSVSQDKNRWNYTSTAPYVFMTWCFTVCITLGYFMGLTLLRLTWYSNKPSDSLKGGEFLDSMNDYFLLKKNSSSWSSLSFAM